MSAAAPAPSSSNTQIAAPDNLVLQFLIDGEPDQELDAVFMFIYAAQPSAQRRDEVDGS